MGPYGILVLKSCDKCEAIGKSSEAWDEVYHGWESSVDA